MLRRTTVILSGLVVAGFLACGTAAAAPADRSDMEDSLPSRDQKSSSANSTGKAGERIYPGSLADLLNGVLGGRTY